MGFNRAMCVVFGAIVIVSALLVPYLGENVFDIIIKISGTFFGPLLAVFLLGMLVPWANGAGALAGLVAGAISLAFVWQVAAVSHWWYGAFTGIPTFVVGFFASLFFPRPRRDQLEGLCVWYRSEPTP